MSVPTTVSPQSSRQPAGFRALRDAGDPAAPRVRSWRRALLGLVLLFSAVLLWGGATWMSEGRGWEQGGPVSASGVEVAVEPGHDWLLWASVDAPDGTPACRAIDQVFGQELALARIAEPPSRSVNGTVWRASARISGTGDEVRVTCSGQWASQVAIAPSPEGPALLRDGRWWVLLAFALGAVGTVLLCREVARAEQGAWLSGSR